MRYRHYIMHFCTLLLLLLWISTGLDKLWDLEGFHRTLQRQPLPAGWADLLYVSLPLGELFIAVLLVIGSGNSSKISSSILLKWGFALSTFLMLAFTVYILLGVLDLYEQRPCGCGSVISGLSWEQHLWFNLVFLLISVLGWWMSCYRHPLDPESDSSEHSTTLLQRFQKYLSFRMLLCLSSLLVLRAQYWSSQRPLVLPRRYPRRFALFPG